MSAKKEMLNSLKKYYREEKQSKREINLVNEYFYMGEDGEYTLDDQTWSDLDMDSVFYEMDRTYSSVGESILYKMLRNPLMNEKELKERDKIINILKEDKDLRAEIQSIFFKLGFDKKNKFLKMINSNLISNKFKEIVYPLLGTLPIIFILLIIFSTNKIIFFYLFAISVVLNCNISFREKKNIHTDGLTYLNDILIAGKKTSKIKCKEIIDDKYEINNIYKKLKYFRSNTRLCNLMSVYGGIFEGLGIVFLVLESSYYGVTRELKKNKKSILDLYEALGEIEACISIGIYQEILEYTYCEPKFIKDVKLNIEEGVHPLLENGVPNTILLNKKGVVLTGTNMSGKSTFLRMLGVNVILAQTFYFAIASKYECCFLNIVSSISPNDDIGQGKSYYMAEAEAILRIIKSLEKPVPVFCIIDEIFRGTNPVERISSSMAILKYIGDATALTFVATHDRELTDSLKDNYDFYYFSENVDSEEGLSFDYKLKSGVSKTRNAIKLLEYIGYPKLIIDNAKKYAKELEEII